MSSSDKIKEEYKKIAAQFSEVKITRQPYQYPELLLNKSSLTSDHIDSLIQSCSEFFNQVDSLVTALRLTIPDVYEEQKDLIENRVLGKTGVNVKIAEFDDNSSSRIDNPTLSEMPKGINNIIELLIKSFEYRQKGSIITSDRYFYTASMSFFNLRAALTRLLARFNHVMMYPHRIIIDRMILETSLRKHGMFQVIDYLQSAEEYFNNTKPVEFCAMSRNALQEAVKKTALIIDGAEHGFSNNCNRFKEIGFLKSTILKQMKEFGGSLSACGSHPPDEKLSEDEIKFLLDCLYSFLGLLPLRLSKFKKKKAK